MTAPTHSTPLTAAQASAAATHAATTISGWFAGSVNAALRRGLGYDAARLEYRRISAYDGWLLERELNRILAVAERSLE